MKKVLILGAGLVTKPMVRHLLDRGRKVIVASRTVSKAERLVENHRYGEAVEWTVDKKSELKKMVEEVDCVVSLLPYIYHVQVAEVCLEKGKDLVTTSYVSDEMQALNEQAIGKDVLFLNEIGLDPGIDHLSAQRTVDRIHNSGGEVIAFHSYCGSLPAPDFNDNPFKYKIGWSPRGVALAGRNSASYLKSGEEIDVKSEDLFGHYFLMNIQDIGEMEIYPNRDSTKYLEKYNISEAEEIFRGTIRYPGWCDLWFTISRLGLLDTDEKRLEGKTYGELILEITGEKDGKPRECVQNYLSFDVPSEVLDKMEWLGLFSSDEISISKGGNIDAVVKLMEEKLSYEEGEKDMVILRDEVIGRIDGENKVFISKLLDFGTVGKATSIARTVSLPAACAVDLILDGKINEKGVHIPTSPEIYNPVLGELEEIGIKLEEREEIAGEEFGLESKKFQAGLN